METITVKELYERQQKGEPLIILDVRTPNEYETVHIVNALLSPIGEFDPEKFLETLEKEGAKNPTIYVVCATSQRAKRACQMLEEAKYEHVVLVEGGTVAWEEAGYPVERGL